MWRYCLVHYEDSLWTDCRVNNLCTLSNLFCSIVSLVARALIAYSLIRQFCYYLAHSEIFFRAIVVFLYFAFWGFSLVRFLLGYLALWGFSLVRLFRKYPKNSFISLSFDSFVSIAHTPRILVSPIDFR